MAFLRFPYTIVDIRKIGSALNFNGNNISNLISMHNFLYNYVRIRGKCDQNMSSSCIT